MSRNTSNERNEVNYIEELKKGQRFCPSTCRGKVEKWGLNDMDEITLRGEGMAIKR